MAATGTTSPRAALMVLRKTHGPRLGYLPHVGAKQRAKERHRATEAAVRAASR